MRQLCLAFLVSDAQPWHITNCFITYFPEFSQVTQDGRDPFADEDERREAEKGGEFVGYLPDVIEELIGKARRAYQEQYNQHVRYDAAPLLFASPFVTRSDSHHCDCVIQSRSHLLLIGRVSSFSPLGIDYVQCCQGADVAATLMNLELTTDLRARGAPDPSVLSTWVNPKKRRREIASAGDGTRSTRARRTS